MGLEGATPPPKKPSQAQMVAAAYERGKAINMASFLEIDEIIDLKDSRRWIIAALNAVPKSKYAQKEGRGFVDTW